MLSRLVRTLWTRGFMALTALPVGRRLFMRLAAWPVPPYKGPVSLAARGLHGYIAASAQIYRREDVSLARGVFIDERVTIGQMPWGAGPVSLGPNVHIMRDSILEIGPGGSISIGSDTHIQARCHLTSYVAPIEIGNNVEIAPNCALFSYNHGIEPGELIQRQPLQSKGGIYIEDDVWLAVGVVVLDGVRIGRGAVVGAGAVVTRDVPSQAIVAGVPARVIGSRSQKLGSARDSAAGPAIDDAFRR
jgi:acetyltransferase-like isoleucine patch superfamily enzyme